MASRKVYGDRTIRRYLLLVIILLILLLGLLFAYYLINRPPQFVGGKEGQVTSESDFRFLYAIYGFEGDLLLRPSNATIGPNSNIYVADTQKNRVVVYDREGNFQGLIQGEETGKYTLKFPIDVAVSDDGRIYVLSKKERKIVVFDTNYSPISLIEFPNVLPTTLYIRGDRLFVGTDRAVLIGTLDGRMVSQVGSSGRGKAQFDLVGGIVVDENDIMYVADSGNYRVQAIDYKDREVLWVYGEPLPPEEAIRFRGESRKFGLPASITLDERGRLYVVDGLSSEIVVLNKETGEKIKTVGDIGHQEGKFYYPDGIDYGANGLIAVADKFNDRVEVFKVPTPGIAGAIPSWLPWLALLPLALLIIWLLFRPRVKFIATENFLRLLLESEYREDLEKSLKKVYVIPAVLEKFKGAFERLELKEVAPEERIIDEIRENFELSDDEYGLVAIARQLRGRKTLFEETEKVRKVAEEYEIANMNMEELLESSIKKEEEPEKEEKNEE